ncbi:MAG: LPP20 family lipoprotein [Elusimicrobia bacterium]|nr:LPP20 family lipoprotein [Elusimicrobiota bacterium]
MIPRNELPRTLALLAAAALAAACATPTASAKGEARTVVGGARPSWVEGESPEFPRARFVLGVGSADEENGASDRARGEVARVFSADVTVNTMVDQTEKGDGKTSSFSSTVSDQVKTATAKILEGVEIVARWKDASTGRYYALAALDKPHALLTITEKAHDLSGEAATYKASLASAPDAFGRAKAGAKLAAIARVWGGLEADSRVLGGGNLAADFDAAAARSDAAKALAALDVAVAASGEGADAVETAVVSALNAAGLTAKKGSAGDLTASADVAVASQDAGDPRWKRSRATATVVLNDGRAGKTFARFDVSAREDATDPGEARRRALATLAKKTAAQTSAAINDYFTNQ